MPTVAAIGVVVVRLFLQNGEWRAMPAYVVLLVFASLGAAVSSVVAGSGAADGRRVSASVAWFVAQLLVSVGVVAALWQLLPLGFAGP